MDILLGLPQELREPTKAWLAVKSKKTQECYTRGLRRWLTYCQANAINPAAATRPQVDLYIASIAQGVATRTWVAHVNYLSSWLLYLVACDLARENLFAHRTAGKIDRTYSATRHLTLDEARALIAAAHAGNGEFRLRDIAVIRLMLTLGIRVGEVSRLRISHLGRDGGQRTISVPGKGNKRVHRVLPDPVADAIDAYLAKFPHEGRLFCTRPGGPLDEATIFRLVQRLARDAGLGAVTPHVLRHTFATGANMLGAPVTTIQAAMGHSNSATTDGYLHAAASLTEDPAHLLAQALG